jgi:Domain of unknown function (DUF4258)
VRASDHARERLEQRGITLEEVEVVCHKPHKQYTDPRGNPCFVGRIRGRALKVVVALGDPELVVTAYFEEGKSR